MNVQPNAAIAGVAGTARAQARGSDTDANQQGQASARRSQSPGKAAGGDQLAIDPSAESGDRDGDGRQPLSIDPRLEQEQEQSLEEKVRRSPQSDDCGLEIDIEI